MKNKVDKSKQGSVERLADLLLQHGAVEREVWVGGHFHKSCKWDIIWNGIAVEFDGPFHYQKPAQIMRDARKTEHARFTNLRLVRFPYWLAVDAATVKHFFGLETTAVHDFPHGFPTTEELPSSFCEKGIENFELEFSILSPELREAVAQTLRSRAGERGIEWVLPSKLRNLLS